MQNQYLTLVGTTPKVVTLNNNCHVFNVSVFAPAGVTVEQSVISPDDSVAPNSFTPPVTTQVPVWGATPTAVAGVIQLVAPVSALRFTPTAGGIVSILQQGI